MKMFSLIAAILAIGACYAGSPEPVRGRCGRDERCNRGWHHGWHHDRQKPGRGHAFGRPSMGRAILVAPAEDIEVVPGTIPGMTSRAVFGLEYKDGVFTVLRDGNYFIRFFTNICATAGDQASAITMGLFVNDDAAKTLVLPYVAVQGNQKYSASFSGKLAFPLSLKAGDKISLRVIAINLPAEAKAFFVAKGQEGRKAAAGLFIRSGMGPVILPA